MKKVMVLVVGAPLVFTMAAVFAVAIALTGIIGTPAAPAGTAGPGGAGPLPIPTAMVRLYATASLTCPGLSWAVPAAIATVESDNGRSDAPGVHSGANEAGAEGPMQFEAATFAAYALPVPPGGASPSSPYDDVDAVYAAVRMLCQDGAASSASLSQAIWDYNHSADYVAQVLGLAVRYGYPIDGDHPEAATALDYALAQLGTPYLWGGETAGVGFDCSGLAQAAWARAGVSLPRVAQDQYEAGPPTTTLEGGDLVFFGSGPTGVSHVGIVVSTDGLMVDAPNTGSVVRVESFPVTIGALWGGEKYLGSTRPGR